MKVYVDELPKSSGDCVFCKQTEYYYYCDKLHTKLDYINKEKECPLHSLTDYTKQVRKEVVQEIKDKAYQDSEFYDLKNGGISERNTYLINEHILDQIQDNI